MITSGGGADTPALAWLVNKLCAMGPPTFVRKLEFAALKGSVPSASSGIVLKGVNSLSGNNKKTSLTIATLGAELMKHVSEVISKKDLK